MVQDLGLVRAEKCLLSGAFDERDSQVAFSGTGVLRGMRIWGMLQWTAAKDWAPAASHGWWKKLRHRDGIRLKSFFTQQISNWDTYYVSGPVLGCVRKGRG